MTRRAFGLALVLAATTAACAGLWVTTRLLGSPAAALPAPPDPAAGFRLQHGVAQLFLREAGLSQRTDPVVVSSDEINAFLAAHVQARRLPVWPVFVRVAEGGLEVMGRTSPRRVLSGSRAAWVTRLLPGSLLDLEGWLVVRGSLEVQDRRARFQVREAAIGRQPVPQWLFWRLLGLGPDELLVWRAPQIVERVELSPGRLVIYTHRVPR